MALASAARANPVNVFELSAGLAVLIISHLTISSICFVALYSNQQRYTSQGTSAVSKISVEVALGQQLYTLSASRLNYKKDSTR